jgi:hypothetical protein
MSLELSDDPFHEISSTKELFFFWRVSVFHVRARVRDQSQCGLGKMSFELLRTVAFVPNRCPHATSEQIFRLFHVMAQTICESKCDNFPNFIDNNVQFETINATRVRMSPSGKIWKKTHPHQANVLAKLKRNRVDDEKSITRSRLEKIGQNFPHSC